MTTDPIQQAVDCWVSMEDDARKWRAFIEIVRQQYGDQAAEKLAAQVTDQIRKGSEQEIR